MCDVILHQIWCPLWFQVKVIAGQLQCQTTSYSKATEHSKHLILNICKRLLYAYTGCLFQHIKCSSAKAVFNLRWILREISGTKQGHSSPFRHLPNHKTQCMQYNYVTACHVTSGNTDINNKCRCKQGFALTGRNCTGPQCSASRPTAHALGGRPHYRRRQTIDASEQNSNGLNNSIGTNTHITINCANVLGNTKCT